MDRAGGGAQVSPCRLPRRMAPRALPASPAPVISVQGSGFRGQGSGCRVQSAGFRVQGAEFRVQGSGFKNLKSNIA